MSKTYDSLKFSYSTCITRPFLDKVSLPTNIYLLVFPTGSKFSYQNFCWPTKEEFWLGHYPSSPRLTLRFIIAKISVNLLIVRLYNNLVMPFRNSTIVDGQVDEDHPQTPQTSANGVTVLTTWDGEFHY